MPRKGQSKVSIAGVVAILILAATVLFGYPTIHHVAQSDTEVVPLELTDGKKAYIQLENSGLVAVAITVNFNSDGSILFENDKGQITDSFEGRYRVGQNDQTSFPFTPIFNDSLKNATLIVSYRSNIEFLPNIKPRNAEGYWLKVYEKTYEKTEDMKTKWKLR